MAEPTLKDVLRAIADLRAETKKDLAEVRSVMATKAETNARFDRVDAALAELDDDLDRHMKVHKEIDRRLDALKSRPVKVTPRMPRRR